MSARVEGLDEVLRAFGTAVRAAPRETTRVITASAQAIQQDWRAAWRGISHAPALPAAVTYDIKQTFRGPEAEIGPDKNRRQGPLGNIIEFGTANSAPRPGGLPALRREVPRFEAALSDLSEELLE